MSKDVLLPKAAEQWQPRSVGPLVEGKGEDEEKPVGSERSWSHAIKLGKL